MFKTIVGLAFLWILSICLVGFIFLVIGFALGESHGKEEILSWFKDTKEFEENGFYFHVDTSEEPK